MHRSHAHELAPRKAGSFYFSYGKTAVCRYDNLTNCTARKSTISANHALHLHVLFCGMRLLQEQPEPSHYLLVHHHFGLSLVHHNFWLLAIQDITRVLGTPNLLDLRVFFSRIFPRRALLETVARLLLFPPGTCESVSGPSWAAIVDS